MNGEKEHIHALIEYPPKLSVSKIVNALKGVSSRRYGQAGLKKPHGKSALWSPSYFAVSVGGAPIDISNNYARTLMLPCKNWVFWRCLIEVLIDYIKKQSRPRRTGLESR